MQRLTCLSLMPFCRSRRRVRLRCDARALALSRCVLVISSANFSSSRVAICPFSHSELIWAAMTLWIWHPLRSGFFPPPCQRGPCEKEIANATQYQVSDQSLVVSTFIMVQAQFTFLILEATLHTMATERHQQQCFDGHVCRSIADEVLH